MTRTYDEETDRETDLTLLYGADVLVQYYREAAAQIVATYPNLQLVFIEHGGKVPAERLIEQIKLLDPGFPLTAIGLTISQYRGGMEATNTFEVGSTDHIVPHRDTLLVDDIKDRGGTLQKAVEVLRSKECASLRFCTPLERVGSPVIPGLEPILPPLSVPAEIDGVEPWVVGNGCKDARQGKAFNRELWEVMYFPKPN